MEPLYHLIVPLISVNFNPPIDSASSRHPLILPSLSLPLAKQMFGFFRDRLLKYALNEFLNGPLIQDLQATADLNVFYRSEKQKRVTAKWTRSNVQLCCVRLFAVVVVTGWQRGEKPRVYIRWARGKQQNKQTNRTAWRGGWPFVGPAVNIYYRKLFKALIRSVCQKKNKKPN